MSKRSDDKRRARAKEKAKQTRRNWGRSPLSNMVGDAGGEGVDCWKQFDSEGLDRMENYVVFRRMRGGGHVAAFFLVDYLCIGLKDAIYLLDVSPSEILATYRGHPNREMKTVRVEADEVRRVLAAAINWSRGERFQLPTHTERCLKILGGEVNAEEADVSDFGTGDGGLYYVGMRRDLAKRLIDETLEEFLDRDDVEYEFVDGPMEDWEDAEEEADEDEEGPSPRLKALFEWTVRGMVRGAHYWCHKKGKEPHPELEIAARMYGAALIWVIQNEGPDVSLETVDKAACEMAKEMEPEKCVEALAGYGQLMDYLKELGPGKQAGEEVPEDWVDEYKTPSDEEVEEQVESATAEYQRKLVAAARRWCFAAGQTPHPAVEDAVALLTEATGQVMGADPGDEEAAKRGAEAEEQLMELERPERRKELQAALRQLQDFMRSFTTPKKLAAALGLDPMDEEGDRD